VTAVPGILTVLLSAGLAGCFASGDETFQGYVEGTYVYISAESAGRIVERPVSAGRPVREGDVLFRLDDSDQREGVAGAEARLAQAQAQLADLKVGKRAEEIAVLAAELAAARASLTAADDDYSRKLLLREKGVVAQSIVDDAKSRRDAAEAQANAAERQLQVARLPARSEEIAASERNVAAQQAALAQAMIQLGRRQITSPASGLIAETFFEVGELVSTGQPVVSVLPEANRKIRFFLPETRLEEAAIGSRVAVSCDGCVDGLEAEIDFIATDSEFTPPILYSRGNREKLVYRVEARPIDDTGKLKIGEPVDVVLIAAPAS
jgi:HlyD family secretion protein